MTFQASAMLLFYRHDMPPATGGKAIDH